MSGNAPPARALRGMPHDDVAVLIDPVAANGRVAIGNECALVAAQAIPAFHKVALHPIAQGAKVHRKGTAIGRATRGIRAGEHVHVHNIKSLRA